MAKESNSINIANNEFSYKSGHFDQHLEVLQYLQEALQKILPDLNSEKNGNYIKKTIDLEKVLGKREAIELNGDEEVFYAQRKGRRTFTKFVKNVEPQDCSSITFVLHKIEPNRFKIFTAYIGFAAEKEPLDPGIKTQEEFNRAKAYWDKTAMISESQEIIEESITTVCPWDTFENRMKLNLSGVKGNIQKMQTADNSSPTPKL